MKQDHHQLTWMSILAGFLRLLLALGLGLLLGALGGMFSWNRQEETWANMSLLCPFLLGIGVALLVGMRNRHPWRGSLGGSLLAWIGFYLTFVVIAFRLHPYQPPAPSAADLTCSPCFSGELFDGLFFEEFFPVGLAFVAITALATGWILRLRYRVRQDPDGPGDTFQEFSRRARTLLAFPLLRNRSVLLQIPVLLLSGLVLALVMMTSGWLIINTFRLTTRPPFTTYPLLYVSTILEPLLQGLLFFSSILLCGMLFGSWRGTFVCLLSLGGSLLLPSLLHTTRGSVSLLASFNGLTFLESWLPKLCATLVVGFIYERRIYTNGLASFFSLLLGGVMLSATFLINPSGEFPDLLSLILLAQSIGLGILLVLGIEVLVQRLIRPARNNRYFR